MLKCKPQVKDINSLLLSLGNNSDRKKDPLLPWVSGKSKTTKTTKLMVDDADHYVFNKDMLSEEDEDHDVVKWCSDAEFKRMELGLF